MLAVFMCALQTSKIEWWDGAGVEEMVCWRMAVSPEELISRTSQSHSLSPNKSFHLQRPSAGSPCVASPLDPPAPSFMTSFLFKTNFLLLFSPYKGTLSCHSPRSTIGWSRVVMICRAILMCYTPGTWSLNRFL